MKAQPLLLIDIGYRECEAEEATHLLLNMHGPIPTIIIPVITHGTRAGTPNWTWNGSVDKPTLKPSILSDNGQVRCHCFVTNGQVQFLADCSHELAGQTVDLLEIDVARDEKGNNDVTKHD